GYKGLIEKKVLVDVYGYWGKSRDFISSVIVMQSNNGNPIGLLSSSTRTIYSISVNTPTEVTTSGWGASLEYLLPKNFSVSGNVYSDMIGDLPAGFVSFFNTPKYRVNLAFNNSGFLKDNRFGFSIAYRWI
ncbi:TonB-dependent receptor, partial